MDMPSVAVSWTADGLIGRVTVNDEHWASVEWSASNGASRIAKVAVSRIPP
jgi:hypothetical protein